MASAAPISLEDALDDAMEAAVESAEPVVAGELTGSGRDGAPIIVPAAVRPTRRGVEVPAPRPRGASELRGANVGRAPAQAAQGLRGAAPRGRGPGGALLMPVEPDELRGVLAERPEWIEAGLRVLRDQNGRSIGAGYECEVGAIDLLGEDAAGGLLAVTIANGEESGPELVASTLSRVGFVRKHLAKPGQRVRAVVLLKSPPADLGYTAAAVTDTIAFKTYQLVLRIADAEV